MVRYLWANTATPLSVPDGHKHDRWVCVMVWGSIGNKKGCRDNDEADNKEREIEGGREREDGTNLEVIDSQLVDSLRRIQVQ